MLIRSHRKFKINITQIIDYEFFFLIKKNWVYLIDILFIYLEELLFFFQVIYIL